MKKDTVISVLTKVELLKLIDEGEYDCRTPFLDRHRLLGFSQNPNLEDDAPVISVALQKKRVVSHIVIIPDLFYESGDTYTKKYWFSSFWVDPNCRGVAIYVFLKACAAIKNQIFMTSYTVSAGLFYDRLKRFKVLALRTDYAMYLAVPKHTLTTKFNFLKSFPFLVKFGNSLTRFVFGLLNSIKFNRLKNSIIYNYIENLDQETWDFIEPKLSKGLTRRTKASFNWQVNNPQYYDPAKPGKSQHVKILADGKLVGFISYIKIYDQLRVLCCLAEDVTAMKLCVVGLIDHCIKSNSDSIRTYDEILANNIRSETFLLRFLKVEERSIAHKSINLDSNFKIKDYEGA